MLFKSWGRWKIQLQHLTSVAMLAVLFLGSKALRTIMEIMAINK